MLHTASRLGILLLASAVALPLLGVGRSAEAGSTPAAIDKQVDAAFDAFCDEWMEKLRTRQRLNAKALVIQRIGDGYSGRFVGYSRKPVKCQARATGSAKTPYVGQIVYHELRYQKQGATLKAARRSKPAVLQSTEVMEIFRHNGSEWTW